MGLFDAFKTKSLTDQIRENKRALDRNIRELDRERMGVEANIKNQMNEMKKMAKEGQEDLVKLMAKDIVRMRGQVSKYYTARYQLSNVSSQMQTMKSQQALAKSMGTVTRCLSSLNRQFNMPATQKMMMEYERQSEMMNFKQEMMGDIMDDVMSAEGEEDKTDEMVNKVLDEVGISFASSMINAPKGSIPSSPIKESTNGNSINQGEEEDASADNDLQARLNSLRAVR